MAERPPHPCATCPRPIWQGDQCGACAPASHEKLPVSHVQAIRVAEHTPDPQETPS